MSSFNMDAYVDVAERIDQFKKDYPNGTLQSWRDPYMIEAGGKAFIVYAAAAYRTPDDERPGIGWAWEPVPGPTQFTKDSELQNAETAAWGRAIVALGFKTKHIASQQEVRNRQYSEPPKAPPRTDAPNGGMSEKQMSYAHTLATAWTRKQGGMKAIERMLENNELPADVAQALKYDEKGGLVWKVGGLSGKEGSDFISQIKVLVEEEATPA